jgi:N-glycosylase/DNA lyase
VSGEIDLENILKLSTSDAQTELLRIKGVGPKVAACALLFGFDKTDAFPIDVWVKRVFAKYYPNGFDICSFGENAGIAQQYLFYYERWQNTNLGKGKQ